MGRHVQLGEVRTWYEEEGDDDEIPMEHTLALRQGLPRSQLAVVPGCGHGLFVDKPELCNRIVTEFLTDDLEGGDR